MTLTRNLNWNQRPCGDCHVCCVWLDIDALAKPAKKPCPHLRPNRPDGCRIYARRPRECAGFGCLWALDMLPSEYRPDRVGMLGHCAKNQVVSSDGERDFGIEIIQFDDSAALSEAQATMVKIYEAIDCRLVKTHYLDGRERLFSADPVWIEDLRRRNAGLPLPPGISSIAIDVDANGRAEATVALT